MITPQKEHQFTRGHEEEPRQMLTYSHSVHSTQFYNSSQQSRQGHGHSSAQRAFNPKQHTPLRDFGHTIRQPSHQLLTRNHAKVSRTYMDELTHLRT